MSSNTSEDNTKESLPVVANATNSNTECFGCAIMPLIAYTGSALYLQWKRKYIGVWTSFLGTGVLLALAGHHFKTQITEKFYVDENNNILPIKLPK